MNIDGIQLVKKIVELNRIECFCEQVCRLLADFGDTRIVWMTSDFGVRSNEMSF